MRMRLVVYNLKIGVIVCFQRFVGTEYAQFGKRVWGTLYLAAYGFQMVYIDVRIAKRMNKIAHSKPYSSSNKVRKKCVRRNIERNA